MGRGAWWATVHRVTKSWIQLKRLSAHEYTHTHTRAHTHTHTHTHSVSTGTAEGHAARTMGEQRVLSPGERSHGRGSTCRGGLCGVHSTSRDV